MIVIFEGHDNSGKSSIAKAFAKLENGTYIQDDTLKDAVRENVNQTYARFQLALFLPCFDKSKLIVIDRAILSHLVYSTVFNQLCNKALAERTRKLLDSSKQVVHIICYKTNKIAKDDVFDKQEVIKQEFSKLTSEFNNILMLDTTEQDLDAQLDQIRTFVYDFISNKV